ncbi:HK97 family phage prohead protease [Sphingomonas parapaucimobilis]|uniref:HK97 family phage prohead protease n=1 Tax=Sphingomonas parapaucimobilis TaxID=28213 RepID=UPI00321AEE06
MEELDIVLDAKALDDEGNIEGLAVGYGDVDHGNDIVARGSVQLEGRKTIPMLMHHDRKRPVGAWYEFSDRPEGLYVKGRFSSTTAAREAREDVKAGAITGLSMGFITKKHRLEGKSRHLIEVALHEISLVTVPMHNRTRIFSVKDILGGGELPSVRQFEEFLRDAGGFSKSLAAAIAAKATPHLRGEPEAKAIDELEQYIALLRG